MPPGTLFKSISKRTWKIIRVIGLLVCCGGLAGTFDTLAGGGRANYYSALIALGHVADQCAGTNKFAGLPGSGGPPVTIEKSKTACGIFVR